MIILDGDVKMEGWNSVKVNINSNTVSATLNNGTPSFKADLEESNNLDNIHLGYYDIK